MTPNAVDAYVHYLRDKLGAAGKLIETLQRGSYVFAYYPQRDWLKTSRFLNAQSCPLANQSIASK